MVITATLNGHEAGNGGYGQGDTYGPLAASPTRRIGIGIQARVDCDTDTDVWVFRFYFRSREAELAVAVGQERFC